MQEEQMHLIERFRTAPTLIRDTKLMNSSIITYKTQTAKDAVCSFLECLKCVKCEH